jgi:hypothetical protein
LRAAIYVMVHDDDAAWCASCDVQQMGPYIIRTFSESPRFTEVEASRVRDELRISLREHFEVLTYVVSTWTHA